MNPQHNNKILILTGKAGQGHISIARSLEYWTAQWGMEPKVLDILPGYINTTYKLGLKSRTNQPIFTLTNNRYMSKLMLVGFNGTLEERVEALCPEYKDYDTVLSTHPLLHPSFGKTNIIVLPDTQVHKLYTAAPKPQHYISFWVHDRNFHTLGPIARPGFYTEISEGSRDYCKGKLGWNPKKKYFAMLAGGEWIGRAQDYMDILGYTFKPDEYVFVFICGKNERFRQEMSEKYKDTGLIFLGWMSDIEMSLVLRACDYGLCFTTAQMVVEAGLSKLPLFIFDNLGAQEAGYTDLVEKNGVGKYLKGSYWDKTDRLKELIPQTQRLFEKNLNKWDDYLTSRPKEWENFFHQKILN